MKVYVCWTTAEKMAGVHTHPCGVAYHAVKNAGYEPEVVYARGWKILPDFMNRTAGRREVAEHSGGNYEVPALLLDDGTFIQGTKKIVAWAEANPAGSPSAS
jgi:hypothetical protein